MSQKDSDVITVTWKETDDEGVFTCPKCKRPVDPDLPDDWEMLDPVDSANVVLLIKHLCGQKIRIDMSGYVEGVAE